MRRLALKLPTVLQVHQDHVILFHEGGACVLTQPGEFASYSALNSDRSQPPNQIWALVDSNNGLLEPAPIITAKSRFFTIQTVPIGPGNFGWLGGVSHQRFYMKPWSATEILQA